MPVNITNCRVTVGKYFHIEVAYWLMIHVTVNARFELTNVLTYIRVASTFHLMFVAIIFSSVWVAEWPPFGKELLTRLAICYLCILTTTCYLSYFPF